MHEYSATVISVYDGDTITVCVDLGFHISQTMSVRLARINSPEVRGASSAEGLKARDFLRSVLPVGKKVTLVTHKDGREKYGRYLADVYLNELECWSEPNLFKCVNDMMVTQGFARKMEYD
jgi:endonuclease YncB( thermonuclease family)